MESHEKLFFEILQNGLWGKPIEAVPTRNDMLHVVKLALSQTVLGIVGNVIITDKTLSSYLTERELAYLRKLVMSVVSVSYTWNCSVRNIFMEMHDNGVEPILLKGQGIAQYYPNPDFRQCGDIDLYTGLEGYQRAFEIIEGLHEGRPHREAAECVHHLHTSLNGVEVEIHRQTSFMHGKRMDAKFQEWTKQSLDELFGSGKLEMWDNGGTAVALAPATYNAFFILHHAVRHMTTEGVGFRQICDWTMLLHKCHSQVDVEKLGKMLKELKMEKIWAEFGRLAVNYLGLPADELPLAPANLAPTRKTSKLLKHIFISGNFGRFDANGRDHSEVPYLVRKWRSFTFQSKRLMKLFGLFPGYSLAYMWHWFSGAIVRFVVGTDR